MRKIFFTILYFCFFSITLQAQSNLFDNTMSTASGLRDPVRQASHDIDAVLYNPAGTSHLMDGLTISFGLSASFSGTPVYYWELPDTLYRGSYPQFSHKVLPDLLFVFKQKKWALSLSYASEGGFGNLTAPNGFGFIDYAANSAHSSLGLLEGYFAPFDSLSCKASRSYVTYFNHAVRLGVAYKFTNAISSYVGLKLHFCQSGCTPNVIPVVLNHDSKLYTPLAQYAEMRNWPDDIVDLLKGGITSQIDNLNIMTLKCLNITPVVGLDFVHKYGNVGLMLEIPTRGISFIDEPAITSPWNASIGTSWLCPNNWTLNFSGSIMGAYKTFPLSIYNTMSSKYNPIIYRVALSTSYLFEKIPTRGAILVSLGLNSGNINSVVSSLSVKESPSCYFGINTGFEYRVTPKSKINLGFEYRFVYGIFTANHENITNGGRILRGREIQQFPQKAAIAISYIHNIDFTCEK